MKASLKSIVETQKSCRLIRRAPPVRCLLRIKYFFIAFFQLPNFIAVLLSDVMKYYLTKYIDDAKAGWLSVRAGETVSKFEDIL